MSLMKPGRTTSTTWNQTLTVAALSWAAVAGGASAQTAAVTTTIAAPAAMAVPALAAGTPAAAAAPAGTPGSASVSAGSALGTTGSGTSGMPGGATPGNAAGQALGTTDVAKATPVEGQVQSKVQRTALGEVEFQRFVRETTGKTLPLFGYELFADGPFTASQGAAVPASYILGTGDEVVVQAYGLVDFTERLVIDREGRVLIPKVGPLTLSGVPLGQAERVISAHLGKVYRNFNLTVTMGRVRSTEVFVVGQARNPGKHVVSGLSSLINALFETGGPSPNGSLRAVELRRAGKTVAKVDLYQFLAQGDNSGDQALQPGDVIFIPPAGPRAAVLGSVNGPAIYELKTGETVQSVLGLTGGLPVLATPLKAQLERVDPQREVARYVEDFALDAAGLNRPLKAGDVLTVFEISPQIAQVVTLQGNVASPMRYTWRQGMKVSDVLVDARFLIPVRYWLEQNAGGQSTSPSRPEVNLDYATIQRLDVNTLRTRIVPFNLRKALAKDKAEDLSLQSGDIITVYAPGNAGPETNDTVTVRGEVVGGSQRFVWRPGFRIKDIIPSADWLVDYYNYWQTRSGQQLRTDINWEYAQVVRRVPTTLETRTFNFSLGGAVLRGQAEDNLELQPGDQITLFTTKDLPVPVEKRTRLVTLSGEVKVPGVYQVAPGETLSAVIKRAGGFTAQAHVFGLDFRRESTRVTQQQNLDRVIQRIETQVLSDTQTKLQNVTSAEQGQAMTAAVQADRLRLANLRNLKATGRVAFGLDPEKLVLPDMALEDGDSITVPNRSAFVGVFGAVNNENSVLWRPGTTVDDVIQFAGTSTFADVSETYVLRADGTVLSGNQVNSWLNWGGIRRVKLQPGDTVVVPEKADRETGYTAFIRGAKDITAIFYQFGLGAAAVKTLRN
jgi:polysaccharide biosynthesis/export protein